MASAGQHLHDLVARWTGQQPDMGCSCNAVIAKMADLNWARNNIREIVTALRSNAIAKKNKWKAKPNGQWWNVQPDEWWQVALSVPGSGMFLRPFLRAMVVKAIQMAEDDLK